LLSESLRMNTARQDQAAVSSVVDGPYNILIVGDIHQGKSQIVEALRDKSDDNVIGPDILEVGGDSANGNGTTKGCLVYWGPMINGRKIRIFDSPGISDGTAFLESDLESQTASPVDPSDRVTAGAGGLLKLLEKTFYENMIHLVLIVHPSTQTAVTMGPRFLQALLDRGIVAGNADALNNIRIIFNKADLLEPPFKQPFQKRAHLVQLDQQVLQLYFPHLFIEGRTAECRRNQYCFTYGVPWGDENDDSISDDVKINRPEVKDVNTNELQKMIETLMCERPTFHHQMRELGEADYQVICDTGFKNAFGSTSSLKSFLTGVKQAQEQIIKLQTDKLELSGDANINEERRRIAVHLRTASNDEQQDIPSREELQARDVFLYERSTKRGFGQNHNSRMSLRMLEDEYIQKGHIKPRPAAGGSYGKQEGFRYKCPPSGRKGDIAWALYQKATFEEARFNGPSVPGGRRVPYVETDSDVPTLIRSTPVPVANAGPEPDSATSSRTPVARKANTQRKQRMRPEVSPQARDRASRASTKRARIGI